MNDAVVVRCRRFLAALLVVVGAAVAVPTAAGAQAPPTVPVQECVPGVTVPADVPRDGPSPVGRCEPSDGQRLLDSAVWLFYVALLALLAAIGVVALVRSFRGPDAAA